MKHGRKRPLVLVFRTVLSISNQSSCAGVFGYAHKSGWMVKTVPFVRGSGKSSAVDSSRTLRQMRTLMEFWDPDGCIVMGDAPAAARLPESFGSTPVVYLDGLPEQFGAGAYCVSCDNAMVARSAARELLSLGFEHYAYVQYVRDLSWCRAREAAFGEIVGANGKDFRVRREPRCDAPKSELSAFARWLSDLPKPCGIFAANDGVAETLAGVCLANGISIPEDVAIVGADNDEACCENAPVSLSSVAPDFQTGGFVAASMLADLMEGRKVCARHASFPVLGVVRRRSTLRPFRTDSRVVKALDYIRLNACSGITVADVVAQMGCSRRTADMLFAKGDCGSILEEIHDARIAHVKRILADPLRIVKVAALTCGYKSAGDMRRVFRKREGCSIAQYRKKTLSFRLNAAADAVWKDDSMNDGLKKERNGSNEKQSGARRRPGGACGNGKRGDAPRGQGVGKRR